MLSCIGEKAGEHAVYWRYGCCYYDGEHRSTILIKTKLTEILTEDEIANFGQPGIIDIVLSGSNSYELAEHLIKSILDTHHLGKPPSVEWLKGKQELKQEKVQQMTNTLKPFSKLGPATALAKVYISYAWGGVDDHHQQICDAINSSLQSKVQLMRDKEQLKTGDSILAFEKEIKIGNAVSRGKNAKFWMLRFMN